MKLRFNHYLASVIVAFFLIAALLIFLTFLFSGNITISTIVLTSMLVLLILFYSSFVFGDVLIDISEAKNDENEELLKHRMNDAIVHMGIGLAFGLGFLIPGLQDVADSPYMAFCGIVILVLTSVIYHWSYLPRHIQLDRLLIIKKNKK